MRVHATGLVVFAVVVLLGLFAGAVPAVAVLRVALVLYVVAAYIEVVVDMVRHRDTHVRSRLLGLLLDNTTFVPLRGSFASWARSRRR